MNMQVVITSFFVVFLGCKNQQPKLETFGLPVVSIHMNDDQFERLKNSALAKDPITADVNFWGADYKGQINYAGKSTIVHFKKSIQITLPDDKAFRDHREWRLSAQSPDSSMLRSLLGFAVYKAAEVKTSSIEPVSVYLNNSYQGLYFLIEPVNELYFSNRQYPLQSLYKAVLGAARFNVASPIALAQGYAIKYGSKRVYGDLERLMHLIDGASTAEGRANLAEFLDVDQYLRYLAASVWLNNWDGYYNNFFIYRSGNKFAFVPWDLDKVFENDIRRSYRTGISLWSAETKLRQVVLADPAWKATYLNYLNELLSDLDDQWIQQQLNAWTSQMKAAFVADRFLSRQSRSIDNEAALLLATAQSWLVPLRADVASALTETLTINGQDKSIKE
ncbi:MAG: hypothetical protein CMP10_16845 [Zetaproteobacteria bacterium]|nr:hypothetical protein [Pseudobdellovibrionaceae bacterium]